MRRPRFLAGRERMAAEDFTGGKLDSVRLAKPGTPALRRYRID